MKKLITLICALVIGSMSFAQKNEIKAIEKAIKANDFALAQSNLQAAEAFKGSMDDKTKDKFYYLKAQALYAGGTIQDANIEDALAALKNLEDLKAKTGKSKYIDDAKVIKDGILGSVANAAQAAYTNQNYAVAADKYLKAYKLTPKDTLFLYASATSYLYAKKYDKSLEIYEQLRGLNYIGAATEYTAVNKETGVSETFGDKSLRDLAVRSGKYMTPKDEKQKPKRGEILKNMAIIYANEKNTDKAIELIGEAKAYNPGDMQLVIAEAQVYLAADKKDKIKPLLESASGDIANDPENLYNFGFFSMEIGEKELATDYFKKAINLDPKLYDAHLSLGNLVDGEDEAIVKEMNSLGTSDADNRKYEELRTKRQDVYKASIPHYERAFALNPTVNLAKVLKDRYSRTSQTDKMKAMQQTIADMEAAGK